MTRSRPVRALTIGLGVLYLLGGVGGSVRVVSSGEGGLWLWVGTIVGGAAVLSGAVVRDRHPNVALGLICVGSLMGVLATVRTIVVPVLAVGVVFLNLRESVPRQPE